MMSNDGPVVDLGADIGSSINNRFLYCNLAFLGCVESARQFYLLIASRNHRIPLDDRSDFSDDLQ